LARQIAISDIHGCVETFRKLVTEKLALTRQDALYLLGDYINKGPDSKGVIDFIFELMDAGFKVYCLRGNHEQYLIDGLQYSWEEIAFINRGGRETLDSFGTTNVRDIPSKYIEFISALPYYIEVQDFLLIHAGLNFDLTDPYKDDFSMLNIRNMEVDLSKTGGRRIIHGHVPMSYREIEQDLKVKKDHISIDAGCVYHKINSLNHLVALDIQTQKLYIQRNIESFHGSDEAHHG
jgi:serine/threonine protein phosphatase 1